MYNYFAVFPVLSAALCMGLGIFTLSRNPRQAANKGFALGMASLVIVETGNATTVLFSAVNTEAALFGMRVALAGESFLPVAWLVFSATFAVRDYKKALTGRTALFAGMIAATLFFIFNIKAPEFVSLAPPGIQPTIFTIGSLGRYFHVYLIAGLVLNMVQLENTLRSSSGDDRGRIKYLIFGVGGILAFFIYSASHTILFSNIDLQILPVVSIVIIISVSMMSIFIVRHRLLDVDIFISRYVVYNSLSVLVVGVYLLSVGVVVQGIGFFGIPFDYFFSTLFVFISVLALVILIFSAPLRRKVELFINRHFYKHKYEFRDKWMESIEKISPGMDEEGIRKTLAEMISVTMGPKFLFLWLYNPISESYFSDSRGLPEDFKSVADSHPIVDYMKSCVDPFMIDEAIDGEPAGIEKIKAFAAETGAVLCAPLAAGQELAGFVLMGKDISGERYGQDDFQLIKALTTQAAVQIKNIKLSQELIAAEKVDAFSKMSTFIMHDLKNLANSLSLVGQNAADNMDNPEFQRDAINTVNKTVSRMKALIEKLSTVGKDIKLKRKTLELGVLVHKAIGKMTPADKKDVIITKNLDGVPAIHVDPEAMEMVLLNILANAYDATREGGRIDVRASLNGENVNISISDTGVGMSPRFIEENLFRPFKSTKKTGFGIGLYQCKTVVEAHGGKINVESVEGKGTTFTLSLPLNRDGQALIAPDSRRTRAL